MTKESESHLQILSQLDKIEGGITHLEGRLDRVDEKQSDIRVDLNAHMKRCDLLEEEVKIFRAEVDNRVKPLESEKAQKEGAKKLLKTLVWVMGAIVTFSALINAIPKIAAFFGL